MTLVWVYLNLTAPTVGCSSELPSHGAVIVGIIVRFLIFWVLWPAFIA
jgi:hypothetical protein